MASSRGYCSATWQQVRNECLARDPVCKLCTTARSTVADHVISRACGGPDTLGQFKITGAPSCRFDNATTLLLTDATSGFWLGSDDRPTGGMEYEMAKDLAAGHAVPVLASPAAAAPVASPAQEPKSQKPVSDADAADEPEKAPGLNCVLNNVCFGPVLSLIGPPNLFGGGLHFRLGEYFGAGVDYQLTPSISFDPVSVSSSLFSICSMSAFASS